MSERVESKTRRSAPIAIDAEGFRRMGHRLVDDVAESGWSTSSVGRRASSSFRSWTGLS